MLVASVAQEVGGPAVALLCDIPPAGTHAHIHGGPAKCQVCSQATQQQRRLHAPTSPMTLARPLASSRCEGVEWCCKGQSHRVSSKVLQAGQAVKEADLGAEPVQSRVMCCAGCTRCCTLFQMTGLAEPQPLSTATCLWLPRAQEDAHKQVLSADSGIAGSSKQQQQEQLCTHIFSW